MTNSPKSDRLLLALQPEAGADALIAQGVAWAQRLGARLDLCCVLPTFLASDPLRTTSTSEYDAVDAVADQRRVADWLDDCRASVPDAVRGDARVLLGDAVTEVREASEGYRLLLVGTHHRRELSRLLLGSVAEALARTASVPTLVLGTSVRPTHDPLRVHLPIDPGDPSFHAVEWARTNLPGAELTAVYLLPWLKTFGPLQPPGDVVLDEARERLRVALADGGHGDLHGVVVVREETNAGEALAHEADTGHVDLIAMPTHGRTGIAHLLFGSVTERVVRAADCPVLVVR
ncbi:MAG: universal stress protein [Alphaproteobacteria bacterium]|nr:universal stress protein [Alphaproteobacteria bacterium]